jgi:hypothetical protein
VNVTWSSIHAGDTVRGADQRAWEVIAREAGPRWITGGAHDKFTLRLGEREVTTTRKLIEPAPLVARADHSDLASAWQALHDNGFQLTYLGEAPMTAVADPFTAPAVTGDGVKRDRFGRYLLPHPETGKETAFTRVTTLARTLADEYGLTQWMKRNVAKGLALRPDLIAGAAAADPDEDKGTLNSIVEQAEQAAGSKKGANFGTAFHNAAQRLDRGESLMSIALPPPLDADVAAYAQTLRAAGIKVLPEYMERIVWVPIRDIAPGFEVVGTLDRIYHQPTGVTKSKPLTVGDLKSAKDLSYSWLEIAIQQACYSHAKFMWDKVNNCWTPMPEVDQHRALVTHCPIGKAQTQIYGVDLIKGWAFAQLAVQVRHARKEKLGWLVQPQDQGAIALHLVSHAASQQELAQLWDRFHPAGQWTDAVNTAAAGRWEQLKARQELNTIALEEATWK